MKIGAQLLISAACLCGAAGLGWWWQQNMQQVRVGQAAIAKPALDNPMLAASALLRQRGQRVDESANLNLLSLPSLPAGTLLLAANHGVMAHNQTRQLLDWVRLGNTLIMVPQPVRRRSSTLQQRLAPAQSDPLGSYFGVHVAFSAPPAHKCNPDDPDQQAGGKRAGVIARISVECFSLPGAGYRLLLDTGHAQLKSDNQPEDADQPAQAPVEDDHPDNDDDSADASGQTDAGVASQAKRGAHMQAVETSAEQRAVRIYPQGKGRVVMLAANYFANHALPRYDHAELLLHLAGLAPGGHVQVVRMLATLPWYQALWNQFALVLVSLACALLLWLWRAASRFGPLLPDPAPRRRALMEHVQTTGRWLWQSADGRSALLQATRKAALAAVGRRAPELLRLDPEQQSQQLAAACQLAPAQVRAALHGSTPTRPADFTRQISILHTLREHYVHQQR